MTNSKTVGELTEAMLLAALLKKGYVVLQPFGDNQRYDLVIELDGGFKRIQCKTARTARTHDSLEFSTCSSYAHRGRGFETYAGQVDFFGVYYPATGACYLVPIQDVPTVRSATLRLGPSVNGQTTGTRQASEYEL